MRRELYGELCALLNRERECKEKGNAYHVMVDFLNIEDNVDADHKGSRRQFRKAAKVGDAKPGSRAAFEANNVGRSE